MALISQKAGRRLIGKHTGTTPCEIDREPVKAASDHSVANGLGLEERSLVNEAISVLAGPGLR